MKFPRFGGQSDYAAEAAILSLQFELDRADVAEMRVQPFEVIELVDVVCNRASCADSRWVALMVDELGAQGGKKALGDRVVPAVAGAAHALDHAVPSEGPAIGVAGVGAAAVGVMYDASRQLAARSYGMIESGQRERRIVGRSEGPSHHTLRSEVEQHGEVTPALASLDVGYISDPSPIRAPGTKRRDRTFGAIGLPWRESVVRRKRRLLRPTTCFRASSARFACEIHAHLSCAARDGFADFRTGYGFAGAPPGWRCPTRRRSHCECWARDASRRKGRFARPPGPRTEWSPGTRPSPPR